MYKAEDTLGNVEGSDMAAVPGGDLEGPKELDLVCDLGNSVKLSWQSNLHPGY